MHASIFLVPPSMFAKFVVCLHASLVNFLDRRFDFINHSQFLNIVMNIANVESWSQWNEIENPHQLIAAARHVTDCNCKIDNHFMNFAPIKLS